MDFKIMNISFCGSTADNVVTKESKAFILDILKDKYSVGIQDKQALILSERSIKYIGLNPHLITIKTGGSNYYLFMTKINDVNCCFFIDRKIKQGYSYPRIISVKYRFSEDIFNDTLFDGELVKDKNDNWMFLIHDLIIHQGERLKCNIVTRFNKIYKILDNSYENDQNFDICPIRVKKVFTYDMYDILITQYIPNLTYQIRGLYFLTLNTKHANQLFLTNNKNDTRYKQNKQRKSNQPNIEKYNKNNNKNNNIDQSENKDMFIFEMRKTLQPEIYDLFGYKEGKLEKVSIAYVSGLKSSKKIKKLFNNDESVRVSCVFRDKFNKYEPVDKCDNEISVL